MKDMAGVEARTGLRGMSGMQWLVLVFAIGGELLLTADIYSFAALAPFISRDLGISPGQVGFLQGSFALTYCLGLFLWSPLSRRLSARTLYVIGLVMMGAGVLVQALIPHLGIVLGARFVIGFFEGAAWLGFMKLVVEWFEPGRRGLVNGLILAAASVAITLAFALGIPVASAYSWEAFFLAIALITFATATSALFILRPGPFAVSVESGDEVAEKAPLGLLFRSRWLYIGGLAIFGDTFALNGAATWAVPAFVKVQGVSMNSAALLGSLMGVAQVFFLVLGGWLSDRTSRLAVIVGGAVLGCISAFLFTAATYVPMPFVALAGIVMFSGVAVFSGGAIMSMLSERFPVALAPAATGYTQFAATLSNFFAPATMGAALEGGGTFGSAFLIFLAIEVLVMFGVLALLWRLDTGKSATLAAA